MWGKIYHALNNTLGKKRFKPLNELIKLESFNTTYDVLKSIKEIFTENGQSTNSVLIIPDGATEITQSEHSNDQTIKVVVCPNSVRQINNSAFENCSQLNTVIFSQNTERIGANAFDGTSLNSLKIPASVKSIALDAFARCNSIRHVTFDGKPDTIAPCFTSNVETINVPWKEGEIGGAPWGATSAVVNYGE